MSTVAEPEDLLGVGGGRILKLFELFSRNGEIAATEHNIVA